MGSNYAPTPPLPGTPFNVGVDWRYRRVTTADRDLLVGMHEEPVNDHVLSSIQVRLGGDRLRINRDALVVECQIAPCGPWYVTAVAVAVNTGLMKSFSLRRVGPPRAHARLAADNEDVRCVYRGAAGVDESWDVGDWHLLVCVQTVMLGTDQVRADRIDDVVGGLLASRNLDPGEDGCAAILRPDAVFRVVA